MVSPDTPLNQLEDPIGDHVRRSSAQAAVDDGQRRRKVSNENQIAEIPIKRDQHQLIDVVSQQDVFVPSSATALLYPLHLKLAVTQPLNDERVNIFVGKQTQDQAARFRASAFSSATISAANATAALTSCSVR